MGNFVIAPHRKRLHAKIIVEHESIQSHCKVNYLIKTADSLMEIWGGDIVRINVDIKNRPKVINNRIIKRHALLFVIISL